MKKVEIETLREEVGKGGGSLERGTWVLIGGWGLLRVWALIWGDVVYAHGLSASLIRVKEKFLIDG